VKPVRVAYDEVDDAAWEVNGTPHLAGLSNVLGRRA
jgi:hypothetical protein